VSVVRGRAIVRAESKELARMRWLTALFAAVAATDLRKTAAVEVAVSTASELRSATSQGEAEILVSTPWIPLDATADVTAPCVIRGKGILATAIDGDESVRLFNVGPSVDGVTFADLTLQDGRGVDGRAGAIFVGAGATVVLRNVLVTGNLASPDWDSNDFGGALFVDEFATLTAVGTTFRESSVVSCIVVVVVVLLRTSPCPFSLLSTRHGQSSAHARNFALVIVANRFVCAHVAVS